jgi:transposase
MVLAAPGVREIRSLAWSFLMGAGSATVYRTRRKYVEGGMLHALTEQRRHGGLRKLSHKEEAPLSALACTDPPTGRAKWTLDLLAGGPVQLTDHEPLPTRFGLPF